MCVCIETCARNRHKSIDYWLLRLVRGSESRSSRSVVCFSVHAEWLVWATSQLDLIGAHAVTIASGFYRPVLQKRGPKISRTGGFQGHSGISLRL